MSGIYRLKKWKQFALGIAITLMVSLGCYFVRDLIGYRSVALILLFAVSVCSMLFSVWPVLVSAVLSALIWDYFFIPPFFTFHVNNAEDVLMLSMYFVIALLNGILTSQIRHFEKQARIKEEKEQALKYYNTVFNSISHELRTPITTIMGVTENLMHTTHEPSKQEVSELHQEIFIASERLNRLVDNLLNMSRLESGFLKPRIDWCDVKELLHTAVGRIDENHRKKIRQVVVDDDTPLVMLDFGLIEQALCNLIHNACVHSPGKTAVSIVAKVSDQRLVITVSDNGKGFSIPTGQVSQQQHSHPGQKGGLGLGLSIAAGFVNMHGGELITANLISGGATATISIPVKTTDWKDHYE